VRANGLFQFQNLLLAIFPNIGDLQKLDHHNLLVGLM
jgi:hypothetical protein